jgi:hypothetical protein
MYNKEIVLFLARYSSRIQHVLSIHYLLYVSSILIKSVIKYIP